MHAQTACNGEVFELSQATTTEAEGGNIPLLIGLDYIRKWLIIYDLTANQCWRISRASDRTNLYDRKVEIPIHSEVD